MQTFLTQLDPATLLLQDDTDDAVKLTLQMMADSKAGVYNNSAGPSRQATDGQSVVLSPGTGPAIPLSDMTSSTAGERRLNTNVIAVEEREEEPTTPAAAAAAAASNDIGRTDIESGPHQAMPLTKLTGPRKPLRKTRALIIMFSLQAIFYVFFAITLAGVGNAFLYGIPAIISIMGSVIAFATVIGNFTLQVTEGRGSEVT